MKLSNNIKKTLLLVMFFISFASSLYFAIRTLSDYGLATRGIEASAVVLDSDFTPQNRYLVEIIDGNENKLRFIIKGYNKQSLIEKRDSARIVFDPQVRSYCHLLYFFETDTVSDNISGKRQPINELREKIPTPPKFRMSICPPILLILSLLTIIYLVIADHRERKRSKMNRNSKLRNIHSK